MAKVQQRIRKRSCACLLLSSVCSSRQLLPRYTRYAASCTDLLQLSSFICAELQLLAYHRANPTRLLHRQVQPAQRCLHNSTTVWTVNLHSGSGVERIRQTFSSERISPSIQIPHISKTHRKYQQVPFYVQPLRGGHCTAFIKPSMAEDLQCHEVCLTQLAAASATCDVSLTCLDANESIKHQLESSCKPES